MNLPSIRHARAAYRCAQRRRRQEVGRRLGVALVYVHKNGRDFIGWHDTGGHTAIGRELCSDGRTLLVHELANSPSDRRFLLTDAAGYSLDYDGLAIAVEKRRAHGWQAFGSYTLFRVSGLQASSGATASGAQFSTVAPPPPPGNPSTSGASRTTSRTRMASCQRSSAHAESDGKCRPARDGLHGCGQLRLLQRKPVGGCSQVNLPQNNLQRMLIETRGSRGLSSQALLDLRVSRPIQLGRIGRIDLLVDVLNVLNDTSEEGLVSPTFS